MSAKIVPYQARPIQPDWRYFTEKLEKNIATEESRNDKQVVILVELVTMFFEQIILFEMEKKAYAIQVILLYWIYNLVAVK